MDPLSISIPGVELLDELGRGSHSVVLRAQRRGRLFAVKLPIDVDGVNGDPNTGFQREAVSLARVRHPTLPEVLEVGRVGAVPYMIMELATGRTLAERLTEGPLSVQEALELALQIVGALEHVHRAGLVHRDIKPRNIIFDSQSTAVRLVDFGFVGDTADDLERDRMGTPAYAAPEQYRGTRARIDGRADLYSLGCVMLECIVGSDAWHEARQWLQNYQGDDASGAAQIEHLPVELQAVLGRLLARDPDERYPSAAALRSALIAIGPGQNGSSATRPTSAQRIVGRREEAARLRLAWAETRLTGSQLVVVRGAPGTGKTAFVQAFLTELESTSCRVLQAACQAGELQPLSAVRQLLVSFTRWMQRLPEPERSNAIAGLRATAGDAAPLLKLLVPPLGIFLPDTPARLPNMGEQMVVETLASLLHRVLADASVPSITLIDDAQWIDESSRRVLSLVAERANHATALYLFVIRDDAQAVEAIHRLLPDTDRRRRTDIRLNLLDEAEIAEVVHSYLGAADVDPEIIRECLGLGDRTPLGVLEILRAMLDEGALRPHWGRWQLDRGTAAKIALPSSAMDVMRLRIESLNPATQRVLVSGAVIGPTFDDELVGRLCELSESAVNTCLMEARRAALLEGMPLGRHRFVHGSVVDALVQRLSAEELADAHLQAARAIDRKRCNLNGVDWIGSIEAELPSVLDLIASEIEGSKVQVPPDGVEDLYAVADHYSRGTPSSDTERAYRANLAAGKLAFASFDNQRALVLFRKARELSAALPTKSAAELDFLIAEALARTGALAESLASFESALGHAREQLLQARALSRITWIQTQLDTDAAWAALKQAFDKMGRAVPGESIQSAAGTAASVLRRFVQREASSVDEEERRRIETLGLLYYQTCQLASQTNKPGRLIQAALQAVAHGERLGPSSTLVRSYLVYAFVLTALGMPQAASKYLQRTEAMSLAINDPVTIAHVLEVRSVIAAWAGDLNEALAVGAACLEEYGYWLELGEFCTVVLNHYLIETVRGRALHAWRWVERAVQKVNAHERLTVIPAFVELLAVAALTTLGRDAEADELLSRLRSLATSLPTQSGFEQISYGARVRVVTERGLLDESFEHIVASFEASGQRPERAHLALAEYYVAVAHARVHACLVADSDRDSKVKLLSKALRDLDAASRIPLLKAHAMAVRGYYEWLTGNIEEAEKAFAAAESAGSRETAPWVLYAVHRGRAHMLRAQKQHDAAQDQAMLAEAVALAHGAAYRAQTVRDEFSLGRGRRRDAQTLSHSVTVRPSVADSASSASRARRYLRALLRISQGTGRELDPEAQSSPILDELIEAVRADRGLLFASNVVGEDGHGRKARLADMTLLAARIRGGHDLTETSDYDHGLLELVVLQRAGEIGQSHRLHDTRHEPRTMIAAPLLVRDQVVGLVYLERRLSEGSFNDDDLEALSALAAQVPVALELARTLTTREQAEENLRSVQKMEAIARLAGGIAHDFNNMLAAIRASTDMMLHQLRENALEADVRTIQGATQRAEELTRQLLTFARGQFLQTQLFQLNARIEHLRPTFIGLLGDKVQLELRLHPKLHQVKADPAQIDQVLTNLVVNARDAMPNGGKIYIESANVVLDEGYSARNPQVKPGKYAMVSITDTGVGMDQAVMSRIFEPFYTTKTDRGGTGLGLAVAYGVVTQSEGHIEVLSKKGSGTTFNVYLPLAFGRSEHPVAGRNGKQQEDRVKTILLVEDEALVRESLRRSLRRFGHQVLAAPDAERALVVAREHQVDLDLLITDVLMPGMNGLELAREITKFCPTIKTLYISGYTDGLLAEQGVLRERIEYLQKPISQEALRTRIDELFSGRQATAEA